jgi:predicted enzyme related to lactoylglutathione lyase
MAKGGAMADLVVHFEIHAFEPQRLIEFYRELFGWKFTQVRRHVLLGHRHR